MKSFCWPRQMGLIVKGMSMGTASNKNLKIVKQFVCFCISRGKYVLATQFFSNLYYILLLEYDLIFSREWERARLKIYLHDWKVAFSV